MALSFPDVIGEYIVAPERFATNGVQFAGYFDPDVAAPGQVSNLFLFLQNNLSVPVDIDIETSLPKAGGLFGGGGVALEVEETSFSLKLGRAEAGLLTLPVKVTEQAKSKSYKLSLQLKVNSQEGGERIRPEKYQSNLKSDLIDNPVGLNLVGALGATFTEKQVKKSDFTLTITNDDVEITDTPLKYSYQTIFGDKDAEIFNRASQEIELRRVKLHKEITPEALYTTIFGANTVKFADAGIALRIGEAIMLAKILTYTCQHFLDSPERYNGLLLPMWERAFEADYDTTDALDVISKVGYYHLLKLSVAVSFNLVSKAVKKQLWTLEERQGVTGFIADNIETGQPLDADFLYLPLLMAGIHISNQIVMEDEDVHHSLMLMKIAHEARTELFTDPDMAQAKQVFNTILKP
jgi:hypothetical protein